MAEERHLATARAAEDVPADDDATKAELQRRMEEARESITQTVTEIKETVTNQYQNVRETISQSLDWREQFRRRPVAFTVGAAGVGLVLGYSIGGAFGGESEMPDRYYESDGSDYDTEDGGGQSASSRSYAAQAITGGAYGSTAYPTPSAPLASAVNASAPSSRPSYSSGYETQANVEESKGPSLFERFKETSAYDRLQDEVSKLGSRAVDELSKTAQNVVLPALLGKLKDLIGIDLSTQREVAQRSRLEQQSSTAQAGAPSSAAATSNAQGGTSSGAGYATSENRGFGSKS